ncbi:histone demethlylase [Naegleria gruberi]|uniref:Histone demethlylase n=1 Tax=Naegleria gruberi TaxID=5762 RepID=D2VNA3_NAEGR|nr:histone demethlylase [Naegleria gruberi]EFC41618.1 histone demethlylase [Naegleria gruberi]|eukprot:XP_002674362.1 histone demethlylase [Naegleria gruberi strain NEG-M]
MSASSTTTPHLMYDAVPVFTPTMEEMMDFTGYIERVVDPACMYGGICKVIPPKEWKANSYNMEDIDFEIATPIRQYADGAKGVFQLYLEESKQTTFKRWYKSVTERAPPIPDNITDLEEQVDFMERKIWKNIAFRAPLYGSDLYGSLFDDPKTPWNLNYLDSCLSKVLKRQGSILPGINAPYLYVGSYKSCFAWHCEDLDLYSINYMHIGSPKVWYTIPFPYKKQFEELAKKYFPEPFKGCSQFLRHKTTVISPFTLREVGIRTTRVTQLPGEFIITLPGSYHQGFNWDINVNEAVNFATRRWIDIGRNCLRCTCDPDTVRINLDGIEEYLDAEESLHVHADHASILPHEPTDILDCDPSTLQYYDPQFAMDPTDPSYPLFLANAGLDIAPVPHQMPNPGMISKYYDEMNASYSYPYNIPTKVFNHEIDMPMLSNIKSEFDDFPITEYKVVSNDEKCIKIKITTNGALEGVEEQEEEEVEEEDEEEYVPTKKKRSSRKKVKKEKKSSISKQYKTRKSTTTTTATAVATITTTVTPLTCSTISKSHHHPLFARFFSRSRLLRK